jgi:hypothetical protein
LYSSRTHIELKKKISPCVILSSLQVTTCIWILMDNPGKELRQKAIDWTLALVPAMPLASNTADGDTAALLHLQVI